MKNITMTSSQINPMLANINSTQCKLDTATGAVVAVEVRMRLIGELCEQVQDRFTELVATAKKNKEVRKDASDKYNHCDLFFLDQAIYEVFHDKLEFDECKKIKEFRPLRNKLLHGDFVRLMILMKIAPTGRQILSIASNRNILTNADIREAILSIDRNQGFEHVERLAKEVKTILESLMLGLGED